MKHHATRITICTLCALFYLIVTVPSVRSYPPFLKKAKELGLPAQNCAYCHATASGGEPFGERAKWLIAEKAKRGASAIDVAWLKDYESAATGQPAATATDTTTAAAPADAAAAPTTDTATAHAQIINGLWKMNASKSKFDGGGGPEAVTEKFDQQGQTLSESLTLKTSEGERTIEMKYALDGKEESTNKLGDELIKSTARWDGDALLVDWQAQERNFQRKFTFSEGGKVMTVVVKRKESDGEKIDTVVLDKQ